MQRSWTAMQTVIYFATGKHPIGFIPTKSYPESRHTILKWWYNMQGYDYNKEKSCGVRKDG